MYAPQFAASVSVSLHESFLVASVGPVLQVPWTPLTSTILPMSRGIEPEFSAYASSLSIFTFHKMKMKYLACPYGTENNILDDASDKFMLKLFILPAGVKA